MGLLKCLYYMILTFLIAKFPNSILNIGLNFKYIRPNTSFPIMDQSKKKMLSIVQLFSLPTVFDWCGGVRWSSWLLMEAFKVFLKYGKFHTFFYFEGFPNLPYRSPQFAHAERVHCGEVPQHWVPVHSGQE